MTLCRWLIMLLLGMMLSWGTLAESLAATRTTIAREDLNITLAITSVTDPLNAVTLQNRLNAIGAAETILLLIPGTWTIGTSLTFPKNVTVRIPPGTILQPASGVTVMFNGPVEAADTLWQDLSQGGSFTFAFDARPLRDFNDHVQSGGTAGISGTLTHTIAALTAWVNAQYRQQDATQHTYGANSRTFVYLRDLPTRSVTVSGCTVTTDVLLVFAQCAAGAATPPPPPGALLLMRVDTDATAITAVLNNLALRTPTPDRSVAINVRDYGILPDSTTDHHPWLQYHIDEVSARGGGTLLLPAATTPGGYYRIMKSLHGRDNVTIRGEGFGSWLKNDVVTPIADVIETSLFFPGSVDSGDASGFEAQLFVDLQDIAAGDTVLTFVGSRPATIAIGTLVAIRSSAFYTTTHTIPNQAEMNEVLAITDTTVTVKYAISEDITSPRIAPIGGPGFVPVSSNIAGPVQAIARFVVESLRLSQNVISAGPGRVFALGGCFECKLADIWGEGDAFFSGNGWSRSLIQNVWFSFGRKLLDVAFYSHHSIIRNVHGSLSQAQTNKQFGIAIGETAHQILLDGGSIDTGTATVANGVVISRRITVRNMRILGQQVTQSGIRTAFGQEGVAVIHDNIIEDNTVVVGPSAGEGISAGNTAPNGRAIVRNNIVMCPTCAAGWAGIRVRANASNVFLEGNQILNNGMIVYQNQAALEGTLARGNRMRLSQGVLELENSNSAFNPATFTVLRSFTVPAGTFVEKKGVLEITAAGRIDVDSTHDAKNMRVTIGGAQKINLAWAAAETSPWQFTIRVGNRQATEDAVNYYIEAHGANNTLTIAEGVHLVDTDSTELTITVEGRVTNALDFIILRYWRVENTGW